MTRAAAILLALGLARAARADGPEEWAGLPIAGPQFSSPEGGAPEEDLNPLLRSDPGAPLDPAKVRLDLATLYQVGQFRAVEAHVEPWMSYDELGNEVQAVLLTYVLYPAPSIGHVRVAGNKEFRDRQILDFAGIGPGQNAWFPDQEAPKVQERVTRELARRGWIQARVTVSADPQPDNTLDVTIHVEEGRPNVLERLSFSGDVAKVDPSSHQRRLRRWAKKAGVVEGEAFAPEAVTRAQAEIRRQLAQMRGDRGWMNVRVTPAMVRTGAGTARLNLTIETGPQLTLDVRGMGGIRDRHRVKEALGIDERLRLTRGWLDEAPDRLVESLRRRGYYDASAEISLIEKNPDESVLRVAVDRGALYRLRGGRYVRIDFVTAEEEEQVPIPLEMQRTLQRVIDQASEDVIRRQSFTEAELAQGLDAARELYRARGYLEAELELVEVKFKPRGWAPIRWIVNPFRRLVGQEIPKKVIPVVRVDEGPLTTLSTVEIAGAADVPGIDAIRADATAMAGEAFSPQRLESLTRRAIEAHRSAGYLEVDAKVETEPVDPLVRSAQIAIRPGPQILLRSKVTRGLRITRAPFVRREADLELGEPVTSEALDRIRSNLYDLEVFRSVQLKLLGDGTNRDLVIDVTERPRWAYEWGFGISTDQGIRNFGRITRRNLLGRAHRFDIVGQIGLQYGASGLLDVTAPDWRVAVSYTAPRFPARREDLIVDLLLRERRLERTWRMARTGGGPALDIGLGTLSAARRDHNNLRLSARLEARELQEVDAGALLPGEPWESLVAQGLPTRWRYQEQAGLLLVFDRRDDPVSPRRGWVLSGSGEYTPGLPWDKWRDQPVAAFEKTEAHGSAYLPFGGIVLELSGAGGYAVSTNRGVVPLEDRFRLGGTGSMRGFERDSIGPRNRTSRLSIDWPAALDPLVDFATRNDPERWVPTGGQAMAQGTAQLLFPLPAIGLPAWEGYAFTLFTDLGNVWVANPNTTASTQADEIADVLPPLRIGTGAGIRVATPVGPLQVDAAINPQATFGDLELRNLLVDTFEEPRWRVHLTLGATF